MLFSTRPHFKFGLLLAMFATFATLSSHAEVRCEDLFETLPPVEARLATSYIVREFSKSPDDTRNGKVTNRIPVTLQTLRMAYARGLYPYGLTGGLETYFSSPERGVLDFSDLHIGKSDRAILRKLNAAVERGELRVTIDQAFDRVVQSCADQVREQRNAETKEYDGTIGTWMTDAYKKAVGDAFKAGEAHSVEIWRGDQLVSGLYGLSMHGVFFAESTFHLPHETDVGKLAFVTLIEQLQTRGYTWIDVQVAPVGSTSLTVKWGAHEVSRQEFSDRLVRARSQLLNWR